MSTKDLVQSYYKSLDEKDDKWKDLYLEDAVFSDASQTLLAKKHNLFLINVSTYTHMMYKILTN